MADNTKIRRIIRRNLKEHGFIAQNDGLNHLATYDNGWGKIAFGFGKYHNKFNFNILRRINSIDNEWDYFSKNLRPNGPKETWMITTYIQSIGKHFDEYKEFVAPFENADELLYDSNKFDKAFSDVMKKCISPFLLKITDLNLLNNLLNSPVNKFENIHDIITGGTSVLFKKVLLANKVGYLHKEDVETYVRDLFKEKLNVKGSKNKYHLFNNTLDEIISFYR